MDSMNLGRLTYTLAGCQLRTLELKKPLRSPGASCAISKRSDLVLSVLNHLLLIKVLLELFTS